MGFRDTHKMDIEVNVDTEELDQAIEKVRSLDIPSINITNKGTAYFTLNIWSGDDADN